MEELFGAQEGNGLVGEGEGGIGDQEDECKHSDEEEINEDDEEEEEESEDSDDEEVDCCERHYTNPLDAPLGRGEEAEYERQLREAGVPDHVTVSRVVEQKFAELFAVLVELTDEAHKDVCRRVRTHSRMSLFPCSCKCDSIQQLCQKTRKAWDIHFEEEQEFKALQRLKVETLESFNMVLEMD